MTFGLPRFLFLCFVLFACVPLWAINSTTAVAGIFGPSNYEECLLENLKGVNSDTAARLVAMACMDKFPQPSSSAKKSDSAPSVVEPLDCHATWNGKRFVKGIPSSSSGWVRVEGGSPLVYVFMPQSIKPNRRSDLVFTFRSDLKKLCPDFSIPGWKFD